MLTYNPFSKSWHCLSSLVETTLIFFYWMLKPCTSDWLLWIKCAENIFYYSKTEVLTLKRCLPPRYTARSILHHLIWISFIFPFLFRAAVMLTPALPLCPLTLTHLTSEDSGGGKLIEALLVNCIRGKPRIHHLSHGHCFPLTPFSHKAFAGGHICGFSISYIFAV